MPRDGSNIYTQPFPDVSPGTTVASTVYNGFTHDVAQDLNTPRPILAGGTGANNAADALNNLGGEMAKQVVTNYDSHVFQPGSFYSADTATASPVAGHAFAGICYVSVVASVATSDLFIEARDRSDGTIGGTVYVRQKKAGVWSSWVNGTGIVGGPTPPATPAANTLWWDNTRGKLFIWYTDVNTSQWVEAVAVPDIDLNTFVEVAGDSMTGPLVLPADPTLPLQAATKQYVDAGNTSVLTSSAVRYDTAQSLTEPQKLQARNNIGANDIGIRSYLSGLTLTVTSLSPVFTVAAGVACDSGNAVMISLPSSISKATGAWTVGTGLGGLDTGAIATNAWYHVFLIRNPTTAVVDACISASTTPAGAPVAAGFTQYRRIGSVKTDGSLNWTLFSQRGDEFLWLARVIDVPSTGMTTSAVLHTLTIPSGVQVNALFSARAIYNTNAGVYMFTSPDENDFAPGGDNASLVVGPSGASVSGHFNIRTNTSRQIRGRANVTVSLIAITTFGWIDTRGKDS